MGHQKELEFGKKEAELESQICLWGVCSEASLFPLLKRGGDSSYLPEML